MIEFIKVAGMVVDQQDDPGFVWEEEIFPYWPDDYDMPDIGIELSKNACALSMSSEGMIKHAFPINSRENVLASSMYFLRSGKDYLDEDGLSKVAESLKDARKAFDVRIPLDFIFSLSKEAEEDQHVFADDHQMLPVTTPDLARGSIKKFASNRESWPADEQMIISSKLEKVAEYFDINDYEFPYAQKYASADLDNALMDRIDVIDQLVKGQDSDIYDGYLDGIQKIAEDIELAFTYGDVVKIASELEGLDKEYGMDECWGREFPSAIDSVIYGVNKDLFPEIDKVASYDGVDWGGLSDVFEPHIADAISEDPESVIPTLPTPQKRIIEDYINERR